MDEDQLPEALDVNGTRWPLCRYDGGGPEYQQDYQLCDHHDERPGIALRFGISFCEAEDGDVFEPACWAVSIWSDDTCDHLFWRSFPTLPEALACAVTLVRDPRTWLRLRPLREAIDTTIAADALALVEGTHDV